MDMWDFHIASVEENTNAEIVLGKFHIARKITVALDNILDGSSPKPMLKHERT